MNPADRAVAQNDPILDLELLGIAREVILNLLLQLARDRRDES